MKYQIDFILNHSFKEAKYIARKFYFESLDRTTIKVPALKNQKVHFTREGWEHLLQEKRSTHELLTRLFTLTRVPGVLKKANKLVDHTSRKRIEYWVFEEVVEGVLVKVVVASYGDGPKFFLSAVWKGTKKEAVSRLNPRRRRMVTSQLLNNRIIAKTGQLSIVKRKKLARTGVNTHPNENW